MRTRNESIEEEVLEKSILSLPRKQQACVRQCFEASKRASTKGMRCNEEWMLECILMKLKSPRLYDHIRKHEIMVLPSRTTLKKYMRTYRSSFGFNMKIMSILKKKASSMSVFQRHGGLLVDEMKLSEHFSVTSLGQVQGFVDLGEFTKPEDKYKQCDHGMVIMFVPFVGKWTQIVGVFATKGNVKGDILLKILIEAAIIVEKAGLFVDYITCDGASWNRKMWRLAGVSASAKNIICKVDHPVDAERRLHFISDFPHLIKRLRNGLVKAGFSTPEGQSSGCNAHPSPEQFLITVNCLSFYNIARSVGGANATPDIVSSLVNVHDRTNAGVTPKKIDELLAQANGGNFESVPQLAFHVVVHSSALRLRLGHQEQEHQPTRMG
ncbi:uncharacterized protein LOC119403619 [Rhipicephalus sanguineus]|uniref:uncharacterized protein LOC119403619 n=1 Tax=Rhipicephalus sanguineus TaxID=34632 RepID=UPI0020C448FB|nr:uncharacterized protein LOC119403619 [Rhipicephalus sanguineus]